MTKFSSLQGKTINPTNMETQKPIKDNSIEVAKCDLNTIDIESMIQVIRGEQVIIDQDVAQLYNVTTKRLNQQVNRNLARFPDSFRFILNKEECNEVVANCDHLKLLKFRPTLPYAFTEQGITQLSAVLHSQTAIETSIKIMNAFVAMRRFIVQNANLLMRIAHLEKHQNETDEKIDAILDRMDQNSQKLLPEAIFPTGCVWDAWTYVSDLEQYRHVAELLLFRRPQQAAPGSAPRGDESGL